MPCTTMFSRELAVVFFTMISMLSAGITRPSHIATPPIEINSSVAASMPVVSTSTTTQRCGSLSLDRLRSQLNILSGKIELEPLLQLARLPKSFVDDTAVQRGQSRELNQIRVAIGRVPFNAAMLLAQPQ